MIRTDLANVKKLGISNGSVKPKHRKNVIPCTAQRVGASRNLNFAKLNIY
jgi:hypothetical protein